MNKTGRRLTLLRQKLLSPLAPWLLLTAFLVWGWRGQDFVRSVPNYGDILEFTWALTHFDEALRAGTNPLLAANAFYPGGWNLATYATGFVFLPALLPLHRLAGAAFAYNVAVLLSFIVAYAGAYGLARRRVGRLGGMIFAVCFTFWGLRWFQTIGHLNILWSTALLPYLAWALDQGLAASGRRAVAWYSVAGLLWAATMAGSLYFAWIGGLLVAGWLFGRGLARSLTWRKALAGLLISAGIALVACSPIIAATWRASSVAGARFYPIGDTSFWSASLNQLVVPYLHHPWLHELAQSLYRGLPYEQAMANFGMMGILTAVAGAIMTWKDRSWRPPQVIAAAGLLLSLGIVLKWDHRIIQWDVLRPLNSMLWQFGHLLKPDLFPAMPDAAFEAAIPLPGFLLTIALPFFERARVFARYAFVASIGIYLFAARVAVGMRPTGLRWLVAGALIFEIIPPPLSAVPYPPTPHPAFAWLSQQSMPGEGVLDLVAAHPYTVVPVHVGETVWATLYHRQAAVAGASSVWPGPASYLFDWLATRPHGLADPQTVPMLRFYKTRYLLLHMKGANEPPALEEAKVNPELRLMDCFPPPPGPSAWPDPICVLEILAPRSPTVNLVPEAGWSGQEDWGLWAVGPESRAGFVAMNRQPHQIALEAFPNCLPGRTQTLTVLVNGERLAEKTWADCNPWVTTITIPVPLVRLGGNEVVFHPAYAVPPAEGDTRALSVGFSRLMAGSR